MSIQPPVDPESQNSTPLLEDLKRYGDRTSSFMTLYPGFETFSPDADSLPATKGQIRFAPTRRAWIAATEPLAARADKASLFIQFAAQAIKARRRAIMVPVSEALSEELAKQGCFRIQVGAEPVFELEEYFSRGQTRERTQPPLPNKDPLDHFPHARSLHRRGARVREILADDLTPELKGELDALIQSWVRSRKTAPLSFLNQVDPWRFGELKKLFVLEHAGKPLAFLSAAPIYPRNGYFFADYIRAPATRAGTVDLLFIESMRLLHTQGVREVRFGLCLFARIERSRAANARERSLLRLMEIAFERWRLPLNFRSIYEFKAKFKPTRWEPLFLVSRKPIGLLTLTDLFHAHYPAGIYVSLADLVQRKTSLLIKEGVPALPRPATFLELLQGTKLTWGFSALFLALHALRQAAPAVQALYESTGFIASRFTFSGLFWGPLFHNNFLHATGDITSFFLFGFLLELLLGSTHFLLVVAAGLWASNPLAWAALSQTLQHLSPAQYATVLKEVDYGSSNAVYSIIGALALLLRQPGQLIVPFGVYGLFINLSKGSWLAVHHFTGLACGYIVCALWTRKR